MINYALVKDEKVVKTFIQMPVQFENVSGFNFLSDEDRKEFGFYPAVVINPSFNMETHRIVDVSYNILDDIVECKLILEKFIDEQYVYDRKKDQFFNELRQERSRLLQNSDWIMTVDNYSRLTEAEQLLWKEYRQILRNLPSEVEYYEGLSVQELLPQAPQVI